MKGSTVHIAVDTLDPVLLLKVTPADKCDRAQVERLAEDMQTFIGGTVDVASVDQRKPGPTPSRLLNYAAFRLEVVKRPKAKGGFVVPRAAGC